jgi:hypothetical protein
MKRIAVTWTETATYEALIEVPDDYPETVEAYEDADIPCSGSGEEDWWERVEEQDPNWPTTCFMSVNERELSNIEAKGPVLDAQTLADITHDAQAEARVGDGTTWRDIE